ncbi:PepSY domain-containing protein [Neptunomonas phycophila]|uniref:PepSY domain-containing protein n=1 Tax=Neptunomonas phycophila TaxID=1572645 RepID=A0ABT9EVK5_9GAMM|nr:PepSY domain-containing protein [Neptunomonas phycophila]MDP2523083.1 PepSY domain-containing protein [Neptunomonas phycophila]
MSHSTSGIASINGSATDTLEKSHSDSAMHKRRYMTLWRIHFFAGLYVVPFMLMLSITGIIMMLYTPVLEPLLHPNLVKLPTHEVGASYQTWEQQRHAVSLQYPDATIKQMIVPHAPSEPTRFVLNTSEGANQLTFVDPYTSQVLGSLNQDGTLYAWADNIHGTILLGSWGDAMIELAAILTFVMLFTGVYLWTARRRTGLSQWKPHWKRKGRSFWRELHTMTGVYVAMALLLFAITGLSWTGITGAKVLQAWGSFPAGVYDGIPTSELTHADLNPGVHEEVPWNLEQVPLPASGSLAGLPGIPKTQPVNLDTVVSYARDNGMTYFRVNLPKSETGVYSVMAATMSRDITDATQDRSLHLDQYTGNVLADITFDEYGLMAKAMAIGIPLHMGTWTKLNLVINTVLCLLIIFLSVGGYVLWWKRRPTKAGFKLVPPPKAKS